MLPSFVMVIKGIDAVSVDKTTCGRRIDAVGRKVSIYGIRLGGTPNTIRTSNFI